MKPPLHEDIDAKNMNNYRRRYYIQFTVVFLFLMGALLIWFVLLNKAPFRYVDGLEQIYLKYTYTGIWLRKIARSLIEQHRLVIPMWDSSIGFGQDIITTTVSMVGDPFTWTSAFVPRKYSEIAFELVLLLRIYFSGIAFSQYSFQKGNDGFSTLIGSIVYTFSASIFIGFVQQTMMTPFYIFPILMAGVDKAWKREGNRLYVFALSWSFFTYFYFSYMMAIFIIAHCFLRFLTEEGRTARKFFSTIGRFLYLTLISALLSMVILLPIYMNMRGMDRLNVSYHIPFLYDKSFYESVFTGLISAEWMGGRDCIIGFAPMVLFIIFAAFVKLKKEVLLKTEFIILTIGLLLPYFGYILCGFGYAANRWVWCYCLVTGLLVTKAIPVLQQMVRSQYILISLLVLGYIVICLVWFRKYTVAFVGSSILALFTGILFYFLSHKKQDVFRSAVISYSLLCGVSTSFFYFCPLITSHVNQSADFGMAYESLTESGGLSLLSADMFPKGERFDRSNIEYVRNANMISGFSGINLYMNMYNSYITAFRNHLGLTGSAIAFDYEGLDRRSELEALLGVKYYIIPKNRKDLLPYGYDIIFKKGSEQNRKLSVYTLEENVGIVSKYSAAVSEQVYLGLDPYERQELISNTCVLARDARDTDSTITRQDDEIRYQVDFEEEDGTVSEGELSVFKNETQLSLQLVPTEIKGGELYLLIDRLVLDDSAFTENFSFTVWAKNGDDIIDNSRIGINAITPYSHLYGEKDTWLINFGQLKQEPTEIVIQFDYPGHYTFENIKVYHRDSEAIENSLDRISKAVVDNVVLETNRLSAQVEMNEGEVLFFAVPYSDGWTAYVNGERTEILRADEGFMALELPEGTYDISLVYSTPGLIMGVVVSLATASALLLGFFVRHRKCR